METSLADIAAVTRDNDGWGGNNGLWLFAILALMGGGFGGWNRTGDYGQFATAASQQEILFGQQFQGLNDRITQNSLAIDNKIDRIGNGIADATFALNNSVVNEGRGIQMQLADCCCTTQRNTDALRYDMAVTANETQRAIHAEGEATRNLLQQNKIESLQGQINQLQLQSALCGVVRYPTASTWSVPGNPFCGCNNGCGGYAGM